ncbi:MAG: hypothetical protein R2873_28275 [Caldilineaceae bacterium]
MGGYVDEMRSNFIREEISMAVGLDPTLRSMTTSNAPITSTNW